MSGADDIAARIAARIAAQIAALPERAVADPALQRRGRFLNATWQLWVGEASFLVRIVDGRIAEARAGLLATPSADFAMIAEPAVWRRLLAADPPPGDHDFLAFVKRKELRLVGNLHPLMSHLLYFKGLLALLRAETAR
jgi:hypothetical protein